MATNVVMPKLSDTMEDGKILRWLKKKGDQVAAGDVLAEVETDKADMELEAEAEGVLSEILVGEGSSAAVGDVIARLSEAGGADAGNGGEAAADEPGPAEAPRRKPAPQARPVASGDDFEEAEGAAPAEPRPVRAAKPAVAHRASPEAVRLAREQGIDLGSVKGSGPGGRIVTRDLQRALRPAPAAKPVAPEEPIAATPATAGGREELSRIRKTVAKRMAESKREAPHFYVTVEIDMGDCVRLKDMLAEARPDTPVSYTHLLARAVALALLENPRINARFVPDDAVEYPEGVHLGIAVALEEGLIVPVLHDCDRKDVFQIAAEGRALVERVRSGHAEGKDLSGGTFTISNLGMFPIEEFAAVINPPQGAVLAVGALKERPVVRGGQIVPAQTMRLTLSSDHRVIDGAEAARFLETLKGILEAPARILL